MLAGNIFILLTSPLHKQSCLLLMGSSRMGWRGNKEQQVLLLRPMSCGTHLCLMGNSQEQLLPYFISTDFNEFSKRTKSRLGLQLQLKLLVLRWKRLQTTPLPHLTKWHHKLKEILLQIKQRSSVYTQLTQLTCTEVCISQNLSTNSQSQTITRGREQQEGDSL